MKNYRINNSMVFEKIDKELSNLDLFLVGRTDILEKINKYAVDPEPIDREERIKFNLNPNVLDDNFIYKSKNDLFIEQTYKSYQLMRKSTFLSQKTRKTASLKKDVESVINGIYEGAEEEESESDYQNEIEEEEENEEQEKENKDMDDIIDKYNDMFGEDDIPMDDEVIYEEPEVNMDLSDIDLFDNDIQDDELEELDMTPSDNNKNQILAKNNSDKYQYTDYILNQVKSPIDMITIGEKIYELLNIKDNSYETNDLSPLDTFKRNNKITIDLFKQINMKAQYNQLLQSSGVKLKNYLSNEEKEEIPTAMIVDNRDFKTNCSIWFGTNKGKIIRIPICAKPSKECQGMVLDIEEKGISTLDVFGNNMIIGHFDGTIQILEDQKIIDKIKDIKCQIIKIKFLKVNSKKKKYEFIYSDENGIVNFVKRAKQMIMSKNLNEEIVSNKQYPVYKIDIFSTEKDLAVIKKKNTIIALASLQSISLYKLRPKHQLITVIEKPYCLTGDFIFDFDFGTGFGPIPQLIIKNERDKNNKLSLIDETLIEQGQKEKILFVASFGIIIRLYEIFMKPNYVVGIKEIGHYINDLSIYKIGFITKSYLAIIDSQKMIKIINTFCFENSKFKEIHSETIYNFLAYEKINLSSFDILRQNNIFSNNPKDGQKVFPLTNYFNSSFIFDHNIFILTKQQFLSYKLYGWDEIISNLCQNEEYKKMIWLCTLLFGKNKDLLSINYERNKEEYENSLQESLYIFIIKGTKEEDEYKDLRLFIEFCVKTGRIDDLFKVRNSLVKRNLDKYLYGYITQFILNNNFSNVLFGVDFIKDFMNYYINKKEIIFLSKILLKLDVNNLNKPEILEILEKNKLINPYIYGKIREEGSAVKDHFKPIEYLFKLLENKIKSEQDKNKTEEEKNNEEIIKKEYFKLITEHDMNYYSDKTLSCSDFICHKLLWYINKCLLNEEYPRDNNLSKEAFEITCKKILLFLTLKKFMNIILKIDSYSYFQLLTKIFTKNKIIQILETDSKKKKYPYKGLENFVEKYLGKVDNIEKLTEKYFYYEIKLFIDNEGKYFKNNFYIQYDFYQMNSIICSKRKNNLFIDRDTIINSVIFLLNYKSEIEKEESKNYYDPFNCHKIPNKKKLLYQKFSENLENNILDLLKCLQSKEDLFSSDLEKIIKIKGLKNNKKVRTYLYEYGNNFEELYKIKLEDYQSKDPSFSEEERLDIFFGWINDTIKLTKKLDSIASKEGKNKSNYRENFKKFIKSKFVELSNISTEHLSNLILKKFNNQKDEIIFNLGETISDALKYDYINKLYNDNCRKIVTEETVKQKEVYLLMKIQLLIKNNHKEQIIKFLKNHNSLCNKKVLEDLVNNKVYDSAIYIYQRLNEVDKCINITVQQIGVIFTGIKNSLLNYNEGVNSDVILIKLEEIRKYLDIALQSCPYIEEKNEYTEKDKKDIDEFWLKILDQFYAFQNDIIISIKQKSKILEKVEKNISNNIDYIVGEMNDHIPISFIIDILSNKFIGKKFTDYAKTFIKIFFNSRRIEDIFKPIQSLLTNSMAENDKKLLKESQKGAFSELGKCNNCHNKVCENYEVDDVIIFKCRHIYHKECCAVGGGQYICYICWKKEDEKSVVKDGTKIIFKKKENFEINEIKESKIKIEDEQKKKKKLLGRLKNISNKKNEKLENFKVNMDNIEIFQNVKKLN